MRIFELTIPQLDPPFLMCRYNDTQLTTRQRADQAAAEQGTAERRYERAYGLTKYSQTENKETGKITNAWSPEGITRFRYLSLKVVLKESRKVEKKTGYALEDRLKQKWLAAFKEAEKGKRKSQVEKTVVVDETKQEERDAFAMLVAGEGYEDEEAIEKYLSTYVKEKETTAETAD